MRASWFRHLLNLYPPFLGAGIHVRHIAADWRRIDVEMPLRWYNRNVVGTHFGGSLFALSDPFFMLMAIHNLGRDYVVWDRAAEIEFVAPGRSRVSVQFALTESELAEMRAQTQEGQKYLCWLPAEIRGADGELVAKVRRQLYVRRKRAGDERGDERAR
jgi:acyl-coenzyme A thioesterase PaaI-like protein